MERELARAHARSSRSRSRGTRRCRRRPRSRARRSTRGGSPTRSTSTWHSSRDRNILTVKPWMDAGAAGAHRALIAGPREFFTEVDYRDPEVMRTHGYHWFDLARMENEPHPSPIRRGPAALQHLRHPHGGTRDRLGRDDAAAPGCSTRARAARAGLRAPRPARGPALGDLRMHSNEITLEQAAFASANTPRGWLRMDGRPCASSSTCTCSSRRTGRAT